MKLKNFSFSNSQQLILAIGLGVSCILLTVGGFSYRSAESTIQSLESLRNGLSICTTRVGQSHYGLLSGAQSAKALSPNYFSSTDECFFQFDKKIDELGLASFENYGNDIYDEFINYKNMAKNFDIGNVPLTRITSSYNKIDQLRFDIGSAFAKEIRSEKSTLSIFRSMIILAIVLVGTSMVFYLVGWSSRRKNFKEMEQAAYSVGEDYSENTTEVERLIEQVLDQLKLPAVKHLFLEYNTFMLERAYPNQKAIEYNSNNNSDTKKSTKGFEFDEDYINSVFETSSKKPTEKNTEKSEIVELSASDLDLSEDELEDQWVSSSSLNNESSYEFSLAAEFDQMIGIEDSSETTPSQSMSESEDDYLDELDNVGTNLELKEISAKVKEVLGGVTSDETQVQGSGVSFDNPIGQKIESIIADENKDIPSTKIKNEEVTFQKLLSKTTKAYLKREKNSVMAWEFASDYQDFTIENDSETLEQILYSVMSRFEKGFNDLNIAAGQRIIRVASKENSAQGHKVQFTLQGVLFNTAELEYLNHNEQSVRKLIDLNLVTAQELMRENGGDINLRNELGEGNAKEGIVNVVIPHLGAQKSTAQSSPMLKRIVRGTKAKLLKSLRRETTI